MKYEFSSALKKTKKGIRRYPSRDDGIRTHDLGFLRAVLYPLSYIVFIIFRFIEIVKKGAEANGDPDHKEAPGKLQEIQEGDPIPGDGAAGDA